MAKIEFERVQNLDGVLSADTLYFVKAAGDSAFKFYITNSFGAPIPLDAISEEDLPTGGQTEFPFDTPSKEWIVNHNLNKKPDPLIFVEGRRVYAGIIYVDNNTIKITFSHPQIGSVVVS